MSKLLNMDECMVLRGIAITSIFLHNYCHLLPNAAHENEFYFSEEHNSIFWNNILSSDILVQLFSYLGHLGVPVFVFLTGYGLSIKYGGNTNVGIGHFIWIHYRKFLFPMLYGMTLFLIIYGLVHSALWDGWLQAFFGQMTLTNNLVLHPDGFIKPGPYWYFGMTMQLYIIYRFLIYKHSSYYLFVIVLLSIVVLSSLESRHYSLIWFKYNSVGWLLPFAIGSLLAKIDVNLNVEEWKWLLLLFISLVSVFLFGFNYHLWLMIPAMTLIFYLSLCKLIKGFLYITFRFVGSISMFIFLIHPIVREVVITISTEYRYLGIIIYIIITISCSFIISRLQMILSMRNKNSTCR